jgi:protein TonB
VPQGRRGSDGPWGRLVWSLPAALVITALAVVGFLDVLAQAPPPLAPKQATMWIVELPPEPPKARPAAEAAPPPPAKPLPPPSPEKPQPPPPRRVIRPEAKRPRPHRAIRREAAQPHPVTPSRPAAPQPPAPATRNPPGGVTMGARALYKPTPEIPEELRHRRLSLVAVARFRVAADGSAEVDLIQPTPEPRLNTALIAALKKWRFFPAMANGRPVASTIDIRIPVEVQ